MMAVGEMETIIRLAIAVGYRKNERNETIPDRKFWSGWFSGETADRDKWPPSFLKGWEFVEIRVGADTERRVDDEGKGDELILRVLSTPTRADRSEIRVPVPAGMWWFPLPEWKIAAPVTAKEIHLPVRAGDVRIPVHLSLAGIRWPLGGAPASIHSIPTGDFVSGVLSWNPSPDRRLVVSWAGGMIRRIACLPIRVRWGVRALRMVACLHQMSAVRLRRYGDGLRAVGILTAPAVPEELHRDLVGDTPGDIPVFWHPAILPDIGHGMVEYDV